MNINVPIRTYDYTSSDPRQYRLWSPTQPYASGDQLARCLQEGWQIDNTIGVEQSWFGEGRFITIYHVTLQRNKKRVLMQVMSNPFSRKLVNDERLGIKQVSVHRKEHRITFATVASK